MADKMIKKMHLPNENIIDQDQLVKFIRFSLLSSS